MLKSLTWYSCLSYLSGFPKRKLLQVSSEVGLGETLSERCAMSSGSKDFNRMLEKLSYSKVFTISINEQTPP